MKYFDLIYFDGTEGDNRGERWEIWLGNSSGYGMEYGYLFQKSTLNPIADENEFVHCGIVNEFIRLLRMGYEFRDKRTAVRGVHY